MKYADSVREFIKAYLRNALVLQTPYQVYSAWLNRQNILAQEGVDFNEDQVLAVDIAKVYGRVEQELLEQGWIHKLHVNYGDVTITVYLPDGASVQFDSKKVNVV